MTSVHAIPVDISDPLAMCAAVVKVAENWSDARRLAFLAEFNAMCDDGTATTMRFERGRVVVDAAPCFLDLLVRYRVTELLP